MKGNQKVERRNKKTSGNSKYLIKSVIKAFQIIEAMSVHNDEIRVKDLSKKMNMEQSTVHRFLLTLEYLGYVKQTEKHGKYCLSLKLFELGNNLIQTLDLHSQSLPVLQALNKKLEETVHLVVLDKGEAVFVNKLAVYPTVVTYSYIGKRTHAHCLASGKVLLAYLSQGELHEIINNKGLPRYTDNTITDEEELKNHLAEIRKEGLAYSFGEFEPIVNCVAAPIYNHMGQVLAAVSVSGPANRLNGERLKEIGAEVKKAASDISKKFGYKEPHQDNLMII
ncbi:MAG: IclR family transcriptional regulator [Firmicutes bacterium]|jgi:DNA-binding IclR family transcriptional regulator|nr:IclR family transcriptional regulator [Bacillota bacterium]